MVGMTEETRVGEGSTLTLVLRSVSSPVHQVLKLKAGEYSIGRDPTCDIVVVDPYVSRFHAKILYRDGKWFIEDLGSKNGTYINGEDIRGKGAVELKEGIEIVIGFSVIVVKGFD